MDSQGRPRGRGPRTTLSRRLHGLVLEQMLRDLDAQSRPAPSGTRPRVLLVTGPIGMGKSTQEERLVTAVGPHRATRVEGDENALQHPQADALVRANDRTGIEATWPDLDKWLRVIYERLTAQRRDLVINAPYTDASFAERRLRFFENAGYTVDIAFVATDPIRAELGGLVRYHEARQPGSTAIPRLHLDAQQRTLTHALDVPDLVDGMPGTVRGIHVIGREDPTPTSKYATASGWSHPWATRDQITQRWNAPWPEHVRQSVTNDIALLRGNPSSPVPLPHDLLPLVDQLEQRAAARSAPPPRGVSTATDRGIAAASTTALIGLASPEALPHPPRQVPGPDAGPTAPGLQPGIDLEP